MFYKVVRSFILFLTWYSFFIIAFGLGFYIMLHKDTPGHVQAISSSIVIIIITMKIIVISIG
jgi:hypothetical protein